MPMLQLHCKACSHAYTNTTVNLAESLISCSPPNLPAMSTTRAPQIPLLPTTTVSPGSTRFAMHASMPAMMHTS